MAEVQGTIDRIFFKNDTNGYTVLELRSGREAFTCVGTLPFVQEGERVRMQGEWVNHPAHGRQMTVSGYETLQFDTLSGIERYLGSGAIKGIGKATARSIVSKFGLNAIDVLENDPGRLREIKGISPKRVQSIAEAFAKQASTRQAVLFLQTYQLPLSLSLRVVEKYGARTVEVVKANPYRLVEDVQGVGFRTADAMAMALGMARGDPARLFAGVSYALTEAMMTEGHTYLPMPQLVRLSADLLMADAQELENIIEGMMIQRKLAARIDDAGERCVYLPHVFRAEAEVAIGLRARMRGEEPGGFADAEAFIDRFERTENIRFDGLQREAILLAARRGLVVITGGPGTGKTTTINCILRLLGERDLRIVLAAPTGRAARRMSEATGKEARTIHRLLEYAPGDAGLTFMRNEEHPLEGDALIVDEMSMVDIFLMRALLDAMPPGMRLIMVGDVDQLPSVGAGNVLRDIIDSNMLPVVRLTEIFRQAAQSLIVTGAHDINHGRMPKLNEREGDFFLENKENATDCADAVIELVNARLPRFRGYDALRDIQVLAPMKRGEAGVHALNARLQAVLNPPAPDKPERAMGDVLFRVGDKIMQIKNDYQQEWTLGGEDGQGVFNGDMGFIEALDAQERTLVVRFDDGRAATYGEGRWDQLALAYCISVHKSQGSEFPCVVMPVAATTPLLMTRNLLYTAVTRARSFVVLVGTRRRVAMMIENNRIVTRYSALAERLRLLEGVGEVDADWANRGASEDREDREGQGA